MQTNEETQRLMELQKEALKKEHGVDSEGSKGRIPANARSENNRKIAALYNDAAEYEAELKLFESELKILNGTSLDGLVSKLNENNPEYEGDYAKEIKEVVINGFKQMVEDETFSKETLEQIQKIDFNKYQGEFEEEIRQILVKRWEFLIEMKKEHISDERAEMKLKGMKPDHIRKVHYNYHGISLEEL